MSSLEDRVSLIEQRNARVETDKAWETSLTRRLSLVAITYLAAAIVFLFIVPHPQWYLAALVPVAGYVISTLGLPHIRKHWEKRRTK